MKSNKKLHSIIAILAMSFIGLASSATSPALATISQNFPNASDAAIASIATLSNLTAVPCTILSGVVVGRKVRFRTMTLLGLAIVCLGGFIPFFANSVGQILVGRAILGIGTGLIAPITSTLTLSLFTGEEIAKQFSRNSMSTNLGAIFFQLLGGFLCNYNWRMPFIAYLTVIPVLCLVFFFLPEPDQGALGMQEQKKSILQVSLKELVTGHLLFWSILHAVYMICFYPFVTGISSIILKGGFGDSTTSALVLSVFTATGVAGAATFSKLNQKFGKRFFTLAFAFAVVGYGMLLFANSLLTIYLGGAIFGVAYGMLSPAMNYYLGVGLRADLRAPSMSLNSIFSSLGSFGAAFVMSLLRSVFHNTSDRFPFAVGVVFFTLCGLGFLIFGGGKKKAQSENV